ncbi:DUF3592 domain-containing protein [Nocardioides sp. GXZ039]|uniref:DUF3592 domain-containing protein n=1 Tax=Nocardioides sp. GXZ039 TaxID=3136018 RepID=UPI0030F3C306
MHLGLASVSASAFDAANERTDQIDGSVETILRAMPFGLMALGIVFVLWSIPEFREAGRTRGWRLHRARVQARPTRGGPVDLLLDDGRALTAQNPAGHRLRAGARVRVLVNPTAPAESRIRPAAVRPGTGAALRLVVGLFLAGLGFGLQILLTALDLN